MEKDLERRTKRFSSAIINFTAALPRTRGADVLCRQLLRPATSIGANYPEAKRCVSRADFVNKIGTVEKEASEPQYWIELLIEPRIASATSAENLLKESSEPVAIFTAIGKKLKR